MQCYCIATYDLRYPDIGCRVITSHICGIDKDTIASAHE